MLLLTQRDKIADRISRFLTSSTPPYNNGRPFWGDNRGRDVAGELKALDLNTATPAQVNEILGRELVSSLDCNECGEAVDTLVQIGEEPDWETNTAWVCRACLEKAIQLIDEATQ